MSSIGIVLLVQVLSGPVPEVEVEPRGIYPREQCERMVESANRPEELLKEGSFTSKGKHILYHRYDCMAIYEEEFKDYEREIAKFREKAADQ